MTRNRAERRHPMMRLKKLIVALMIDVNDTGGFRKEFLVSRTVTNKIITMNK
ncbi:hypothetical protein ACVVG6_003602 [Escherichia coli]